MKKWTTRNVDESRIMSLKKETGLSRFLCDILVRRNIFSKEQAEKILGKGGLSDPFLLEDMENAVEIIREAIENDEKITVYGDYDCDGVTSTVMLYTYLEAQGAEVDWYIPSREEGYGMNISALEKIISNGTNLIITVDNGISAVDEAKFIRENGTKLVITDHHQVPPVLPWANAVINPHRSDDMSPFKELCGAGVVLKLICALEDGNTEWVMEQFSELAAIGTIGDIVPLVDENRFIVESGLMNMEASGDEDYDFLENENVGLDELIKIAGIRDRISSTSIAFSICPRINAAGRWKNASAAVELFLSENREYARIKAEELNLYNTNRQEAEKEIMAQVEEQLRQNPEILCDRVLVVSGEGWNHGIIGIVSARLLEKYEKPNLVISIEKGEGRGSARSIEGFSLYHLLEGNSDLLLRFGGHVKAAGFSIKADKIDELRERIRKYTAEHFTKMPEYTILADKEILPSELEIENIEELEKLHPFGEGNQIPLFILRNCKITDIRSLKSGKYTSFSFAFGKSVHKALSFSIAFDAFPYRCGESVDILGNAELNTYNDKTSVVIKTKEIRPSGFDQDKYFAAFRVYEQIKRGEEFDKRLSKRIVPDRDTLKIIYDIVRKNGGRMTISDMAFLTGEINYCMFRIGLDALSELGLIELDIVSDTVSLKKSSGKVDLDSSVLLNSLKK